MNYSLIYFICALLLSCRSSQAADVSDDCVVSHDGSVVCTDTQSDGTTTVVSDADSIVDDDDDDYFEGDSFEDDDDDNFTQDDVNFVAATNPIDETNCLNEHELCDFWASKGECENNPNYMLQGCRKACNNCAGSRVPSNAEAQLNEKDRILKEVERFGVKQNVDGTKSPETMLVVRQTVDYMRNYIHAENPTHKLGVDIIKACTNNDKLCAFWAAIGECEKNAGFMTTKCAPSCRTCAEIDFNNRCPKRPDDAVPALKPGELNVMFQKIIDDAPGNQNEETQLFAREKKVQENGTPFYTVNVLSQPESPVISLDENDETLLNLERDAKEHPWAITFDNFLTDDECDHLIQLGYKNGYKRSEDVGKLTEDGSYGSVKSQRRTSENAWCDDKSGCRHDPIAERVMERIANVTNIEAANFEDFQMLRYEEGQFYRTHHDYIDHQKERSCGPRILTFYLYLSDVEEGGGTGLHIGNIQSQDEDYLVVSPKKGRALLWPSVLNSDPIKKDFRTMHQAITVEKGTKFGANVWIHLYDVVSAQKRGCT